MSERPKPGPKVRELMLFEHGPSQIVGRADFVAVEEPLEIRIVTADSSARLGITMRTPGNDFELIAGFLIAEGIITKRRDILDMAYCELEENQTQHYNVVSVRLGTDLSCDISKIQRSFAITSACGVCGRGNIEDLHARGLHPTDASWNVSSSVLMSLGGALRSKQAVFGLTGGLHAAALMTPEGSILCAREDVGRHNAVDKAVGTAFLDGAFPLETNLLMVSGRTSFEIVQKAISASIPMVCGISAPSSLAVDLAQEFNITLVGFLRESRFNVYSGAHRIERDKR